MPWQPACDHTFATYNHCAPVTTGARNQGMFAELIASDRILAGHLLPGPAFAAEPADAA
jgi:hypothetical protein